MNPVTGSSPAQTANLDALRAARALRLQTDRVAEAAADAARTDDEWLAFVRGPEFRAYVAADDACTVAAYRAEVCHEGDCENPTAGAYYCRQHR